MAQIGEMGDGALGERRPTSKKQTERGWDEIVPETETEDQSAGSEKTG
jgi:hypothetical protein